MKTHFAIYYIFDIAEYFYKGKAKPTIPSRIAGLSGAAGRIRTADLILTKDALYLLSYSSR